MRTVTRPIGADVLLALDDMSARFLPLGVLWLAEHTSIVQNPPWTWKPVPAPTRTAEMASHQDNSCQVSARRLFFQTAPQIFHILLQDKKDEDGKPPLAKGSSFRKPGPLSSVCRSSKSISFAHFPYSWKLAVVRHILKAGSNKYHPISLLILSDSARINSDVVQHYQLETISW